MIEVTVKTLDSQNHPFSVEDEITVKEFKEKIAEKVNISPDTQRLIYCGRVLQDIKKLNEYDVNGKVIHLVQRPPPQAGTSSQASSSTSNTNSRFTTRHHFNPPQGNQIYLGSMAYSTDMDSQQGIPQLSPNQNLSNSRLLVARRMLRIAANTITQLENMTSENNTNGTTSTDNTTSLNLDEPIDTTPVLAAQVFVPAMSNIPDQQHDSMAAAALQAALAATNNFRNITVNSNTNLANSSAQVENISVDSHDTAADLGNNDNRDSQSQNDESGNNQNMTRTTKMAELLDILSRIQNRLQPFLQQYHEFMRDDPVFNSEEEANNAQVIFDRVSFVMHALSHAYHAMSDIICPLNNRTAPRPLLCRPILVQHAVLQAGISVPVQVEAQIDINTHHPLLNPNSSSDSNNADTQTEQIPEVNFSTSTSTSVSESISTQSSNEPSAIPAENRDHPHDVSQQTQQQQRQTPRSRVTVGGLHRNMDIFVAMAPDNAAEVSNPLETFISGASMGGMPNQEMINNFVSAVTNSVIRGVSLGTNGMPMATNISVSTSPFASSNTSSTSQVRSGDVRNESRSESQNNNNTTASSTDDGGISATGPGQSTGQNSQARGNTATLPTTSTQTPRSTPRPHVHLAPHSFRGFDPFLQCNSHHVGSRSSRPNNRGQEVLNSFMNLRRNRSSSLPRDTMSSSTVIPASTQTSSTSINENTNNSTSVVNSLLQSAMELESNVTANQSASAVVSDSKKPLQKILLPTSSTQVGNSEVSAPLPDVTVGSETWHSNVPADWVSILTRDVQTQRQQPAQAPFSDAYMSGVPAKRRKIISCSKPQGSISQVISDGLRQAVMSTGLSSVAPIDTVTRAAGSDQALQTAYREELCQSIRSRPSHATAPEIAPIERFPNAKAAGYFDKS